MSALLIRIWSSGIVGTFLAGLFVLLPVALTVIILDWIIEKIAGVLGPGTFLGGLLSSGGGTIVGPDHGALAFIVGLILALALVWFIGLVVKSQARQQMSNGIDRLFDRLPLVRSIYKPVSQVVRLFSKDGDQDLQAMTVVSCRLGGPDGVDLLGLMTTSKKFTIAGEIRRLIYLPASPLPMSGGLILVPEEKIVPMPDVSVDDMMQIFFSLGIVTPDAITNVSPFEGRSL